MPAAPLQEACWSKREQLLIPLSPPRPVHWHELKEASPVHHLLAPSALALAHARQLARHQLHTREEGQLRRRLLATGRFGRGAPLAWRLS